MLLVAASTAIAITGLAGVHGGATAATVVAAGVSCGAAVTCSRRSAVLRRSRASQGPTLGGSSHWSHWVPVPKCRHLGRVFSFLAQLCPLWS